MRASRRVQATLASPFDRLEVEAVETFCRSYQIVLRRHSRERACEGIEAGPRCGGCCWALCGLRVGIGWVSVWRLGSRGGVAQGMTAANVMGDGVQEHFTADFGEAAQHETCETVVQIGRESCRERGCP